MRLDARREEVHVQVEDFEKGTPERASDAAIVRDIRDNLLGYAAVLRSVRLEEWEARGGYACRLRVRVAGGERIVVVSCAMSREMTLEMAARRLRRALARRWV